MIHYGRWGATRVVLERTGGRTSSRRGFGEQAGLRVRGGAECAVVSVIAAECPYCSHKDGRG